VSFFLVFLAIILVAGLVWFALGIVKGRFAENEQALGGFDEPGPALPPVLLPEHPNPEDIDGIRFSLSFRGYRMDQVDEVLERLRDRISVQAALIEALTTQLGADREPRD
jgi:DivIVA domain-containing protein